MCFQINGYTLEQLATIFRAPEYGGALRELIKQPLDDYLEGNINKADALMAAAKCVLSANADSFFSGDAWLNLYIDTCIRQSQGLAAMVRSSDPEILDQWPAWQLARTGSRIMPRNDWWQRWHSAGEATGWDGASKAQMVALKSSPIWQALGDGAGGFGDALGNPYPPFAIGSGLGWIDVDAEGATQAGFTWKRLVIEPDNEYQAAYDRLSPEHQAEARAWLDKG